MSNQANTARQLWASLRMLLVFMVLLGVIYPAVVWGIGQTAFHSQANGSQITVNGKVIGSSLLGQDFTGNQWFHGRPSASGDAGNASGGTNLPPGDPRLSAEVAANRKAAGSVSGPLPPDALTSSASGLDPDISPDYAAIQVDRVAAARHLPAAEVRALVAKYTQGRVLGFLGMPRVDVVELNLALSKLSS